MSPVRFLLLTPVLWLCPLAARAATPAPGSVDSTFTGTANNTVSTLAVQPNGSIVAGGYFITLDGSTRNHVGRITATGALDASFNPSANANVSFLAVQPDGRLLVSDTFTTLQPNGASAATVRNRIARFNSADGISSNGTLDGAFNPNADDTVRCLALQPDGKVLIGGPFNHIGGVACSHIARLNADGTLDLAFTASLSSYPNCLILQPDGKILLGGQFTSVNGAPRAHIARLNADGSVDPAFNPSANDAPFAMVVQPDGKILLGGPFTTVDEVTRNRVARIYPSGAIDDTFAPDLDATVFTMALQTDGEILIGGDFTQVGVIPRNKFARLNPDGSVDAAIDPKSNGFIYNVSQQADGKILLGGGFSVVGGATHHSIARLYNDPATQTLSVLNRSHVQWLRGGSSPEAQSVTFELSVDSGASWTPLGSGLRITGGWQLTGLNMPASGQVRARARTLGGIFNGTSGLVETIKPYTGAVEGLSVITSPATNLTTTSATLNGVIDAGRLETNGNIYLDGAIVGVYYFLPGTGSVPIKVDVGGLTPGSTHTFYAVASNAQDRAQGATLSFTTVPLPYTVTPSAGPNGTISPDAPQTTNSGGSLTFTATPASGYTVDQWLVNGASAQSGGSSFVLANIGADAAVQVIFTPVTYPVTPTAGPNGAVTPGTVVAELPGGSIAFTAVPNLGYQVDQWLLNGTAVQTGGLTYLLNNVSAADSVAVTFKSIAGISYGTYPAGKPQPTATGFYSTEGAYGGEIYFRRAGHKIVGVQALVLADASTGGVLEVEFDESGRPESLYTSDGVALSLHQKSDGRVKVTGNDATGAPVRVKLNGFETSMPEVAAELAALTAELQAADFSEVEPAEAGAPRVLFVRPSDAALSHLLSITCKVGVLALDVAATAIAAPTGVGVIIPIIKLIADGVDLVAAVNEAPAAVQTGTLVTSVAKDGAEVYEKSRAIQLAFTSNKILSKTRITRFRKISSLGASILLDYVSFLAEKHAEHLTPHDVQASSDGDGAVAPTAVQSVDYYGQLTFTATPNAGFQVDEWLVNGEAQPVEGNTFTLKNVQEKSTVYVTFKRLDAGDTWLVTPLALGDGGITPSSSTYVKNGTDISFTASHDSNHAVDVWQIAGNFVQTGGDSYTLRNVTADQTVSVTFKSIGGGGGETLCQALGNCP